MGCGGMQGGYGGGGSYGKGGGKGGDASENLFVAGLPNDIDEQKLREVFSNYGQVMRCRVLPPNNSNDRAALVMMRELAQAVWLVDNLNGNVPIGLSGPVKISYSASKQARSSPYGRPFPTRPGDFSSIEVKPATHTNENGAKVWIGCIPAGTSQEMIRMEFSKFGPVNDVFVRDDGKVVGRMWGFVTFAEASAATAALEACKSGAFAATATSAESYDAQGAWSGYGEYGAGGQMDMSSGCGCDGYAQTQAQGYTPGYSEFPQTTAMDTSTAFTTASGMDAYGNQVAAQGYTTQFQQGSQIDMSGSYAMTQPATADGYTESAKEGATRDTIVQPMDTSTSVVATDAPVNGTAAHEPQEVASSTATVAQSTDTLADVQPATEAPISQKPEEVASSSTPALVEVHSTSVAMQVEESSSVAPPLAVDAPTPSAASAPTSAEDEDLRLLAEIASSAAFLEEAPMQTSTADAAISAAVSQPTVAEQVALTVSSFAAAAATVAQSNHTEPTLTSPTVSQASSFELVASSSPSVPSAPSAPSAPSETSLASAPLAPASAFAPSAPSAPTATVHVSLETETASHPPAVSSSATAAPSQATTAVASAQTLQAADMDVQEASNHSMPSSSTIPPVTSAPVVPEKVAASNEFADLGLDLDDDALAALNELSELAGE